MRLLTETMTVAAIIIIGAAAPVFPQDQPDLEKMGAALRANQESLRTYTWQSRVTFVVDGVQRQVDVYKVAYDENGSLQRTQTGGEKAKGRALGPNGKKLSKKQHEAALEFVTKVKNQFDAYLSPLFAEKAVATATATVEGDILRLQSHDVVNPGDTVDVTLSATTGEPRNLRATATIEGSPVTLDVTFQVLDFGPFCPANSVTSTSWNGMQLTVTTENSDYS